MQKTGDAFAQILPFIYDDDKFLALANRTHIEDLIRNYSRSIHSISQKKARKLIGDDPHVVLTLDALKGQTETALEYYRQGRREYSQQLLKSTTSTCFSCHTRLPKGPTDYFWGPLKIDAFELNAVEKTQLHIAMRNFEKAKKFIRSYVNQPKTDPAFFNEDEKLIHLYLFIAIRGMDNLKDAYQFLQSQSDNKKISGAFKSTMASWKKDLIYWMSKEKNGKKGPPDISKLLKVKGFKISAITPEDLIKQLIATKQLHLQLAKKGLGKAKKSEAYLYLGQVYDRLVEGSFWELPEVYYEACIKNTPNTKIARQCYDLYNENITFGFTGSGGTNIPGYALTKRKNLKKLSGKK